MKVNFYYQPLFAVAVGPLFIVITALSALLVWSFIRAVGFDVPTALWGFLFYGVASPAIVYSKVDFAQPLEALCWMAGLYGTVRYYQQPQPKWGVLASFALFYGTIMRPLEGAFLAAAMFALAGFGLKESFASRARGIFSSGSRGHPRSLWALLSHGIGHVSARFGIWGCPGAGPLRSGLAWPERSLVRHAGSPGLFLPRFLFHSGRLGFGP